MPQLNAMTSIGQPVPEGHQLVLTFVPVVSPPKPQANPKKGKGGAAAGGAPKAQNKSGNKKGRGNKK